MRLNAHASSWLIAVLALLAPGSASAQAHSKSDELGRARALDREGAKAYGEGRYNDAIRYFEEAYRLGGPAFELWNVAKCHLRLDQPEQAADMLDRYLALPNLPKEDREEATQQLESLKRRPSTLTVSSTPSGAQVCVDGKPVEGRTPVSISIGPGSHTVTVSGATNVPYTRQIEARYGRAVIVDASLGGGAAETRPPPPANPYDRSEGGPVTLRGGIWLSLPRYGTVGGKPGPGFLALGTYRVGEIGGVAIAFGGLVSVAADAWQNRTGKPNEAPGCAAPITHAQDATAISFLGIGTASFPIASRLRLVGIGGVGGAAYAVDNVGGDLFVASCRPSPGVRPALLFGAELSYAVTPVLHVSAFPITWQVQPAFDGTRAVPRDTSGIWMRFGVGIGAGVDL